MLEKRAHLILAILIIFVPIFVGGFYTSLLVDRFGEKSHLTYAAVKEFVHYGKRAETKERYALGAFGAHDGPEFYGMVELHGTYKFSGERRLSPSTLEFIPDVSEYVKLPWWSYQDQDTNFDTTSQMRSFTFANDEMAKRALGVDDLEEGSDVCYSGKATILISTYTPCTNIGECGPTATFEQIVDKDARKKIDCAK